MSMISKYDVRHFCRLAEKKIDSMQCFEPERINTTGLSKCEAFYKVSGHILSLISQIGQSHFVGDNRKRYSDQNRDVIDIIRTCKANYTDCFSLDKHTEIISDDNGDVDCNLVAVLSRFTPEMFASYISNEFGWSQSDEVAEEGIEEWVGFVLSLFVIYCYAQCIDIINM